VKRETDIIRDAGCTALAIFFLESKSLSIFQKTKRKYLVPADVSKARRRQQPPGVDLLPQVNS
jgi:hypothetical protein